jgi:hypothetical protein
MKPTLKISTKNKFHNELWVSGDLVAGGNSGLEDVELKTNGKRTMLVLTIAADRFNIMMTDVECPEKHHYEKVEEALSLGNAPETLGVVCEMLKTSIHACDGCPYRPKTASRQDARRQMGSGRELRIT